MNKPVSPVWNYPIGSPQFSEPGKFTAWIFGSYSPRKKRSSGAWRLIRNADETSATMDAVPSHADSDMWRGTAGAFVGVLSALPPKSSAVVLCSNEAAVVLISEIAQAWDKSALRRKDGSYYAACDIWLEGLNIGSERDLSIRAQYEPRKSKRSNKIFDELSRLTRKALDGAGR